MPRLRISGIVEESIVDGPGLRYVVFTQGCPHHCPGCHNPQTHDFDGGEFRDTDDILRQFMENPLLSGITFSGGEPFVQAEPLCHLADAVHAAGKNVYAYSGYTCEELYSLAQKIPAVGRLLDKVDVLVDGPYVEALRDLELDFRGSSNQRVLDRAAIEAPWRRDFCRGAGWGKEGAFFVKTAPSFPQAPIQPRKNFFQVCMPVPVVVWW